MRYGLILILAASLHADTVVRMACGGPGGTDAAGNVWAADNGMGGGAAWTVANQPALASQPIPYQSLCYSAGTSPFSRTFTVPAGDYTVTLKMLEPTKTAAGQRLFGASANGATLITGMDLFAVAGGALKPFDRVFTVSAPGGSIQIVFTSTIANALISAIQIDTVPIIPPDDSVKITCKSGTITVGTDLTAAGPTQEITILQQMPGNWRWEQITICPTTRFLGQPSVTASIGRPGVNNTEMTGAAVPMLDSSNNDNCWTARPSPPQLIGAYDVVVNFHAYSVDSTNTQIDGDLSKLSSGVASWEACGYPGKLGVVALGSQTVGGAGQLLRCSGAYSQTDPDTGKTITGYNCGGLFMAIVGGIPIVGPNMKPAQNPRLTWTRIK